MFHRSTIIFYLFLSASRRSARSLPSTCPFCLRRRMSMFHKSTIVFYLFLSASRRSARSLPST